MRAKVLLFLVIFTLCGITQAFAASNSVIVHFEQFGKADLLAKAVGGRVLAKLANKNVALLETPAVERLIAWGKAHGVRFLEPNLRVKLNSGPGGIIINAGGQLPRWYDAQPALARVGKQAAHLVTQGQAVVIADVNSAVDYGHPALAGSLTSGWDFILAQPYTATTAGLNQSSTGFLDQSSTGFLDGSIPTLDTTTGIFLTNAGATIVNPSSLIPQASHVAYSHGTLTAGVIRAVAPQSMIMPLRAFNDEGDTDLFTLASAIDYAVSHGAQVINLSFGLYSDSQIIRTSIQTAVAAGITVVASAGNHNVGIPQYPASYPGVISVGATDIADTKGTFSNFGAQVDVSAPGVNVVSAFPGGLFAVVSGTSFSAPIVAAEAALLRSLQPTDPTPMIKQNTVNVDVVNPGYQGLLGTGRVNLSQAVGGQ
jgi:subtilisin family serine protease